MSLYSWSLADHHVSNMSEPRAVMSFPSPSDRSGLSYFIGLVLGFGSALTFLPVQ
jgi:hypothetical protein